MVFNFLKVDVREQKMLSWASVGLLVFVSAFMWVPSRDGLQIVYLFFFFLPMLFVLPFRKPQFKEYGGWMTVSALLYAGFSTVSSLWGEPKDFSFFVLQWCVLAVWLCGSSLIFSRRYINVEKYLNGLIVLGCIVTVLTLIYYYGFIFGPVNNDIRLPGFNVFRNPNEIGAMAGIVALLAYVKALQSVLVKRALVFYLLVAIALMGLVASFSRGALLGFLLMALSALIIIRPQLKIWLPPLAMVFIALAVLYLRGDLVVDFQGRGTEIGERANVWSEVLSRSKERIFSGIGMAKDTTIIIPNVNSFNHAHNAWLDTFYRTGLIGLVLVLLHLGSLAAKFSNKSYLLSLFLWLGYGCICSLVDSRCFFWEIGAKWFLYWIPAGLIAASITGMNSHSKQVRIEN